MTFAAQVDRFNDARDATRAVFGFIARISALDDTGKQFVITTLEELKQSATTSTNQTAFIDAAITYINSTVTP